MGAWLHEESPEEIQRIQIDAGAEGEAPAPDPEGTRPKRKIGETLTAGVWKHFIQGKVLADESYTATCKYCGHVYPMDNQRGTSNMKNHIKRGCKRIPSAKRHKHDALFKTYLEENSNSGQNQASNSSSGQQTRSSSDTRAGLRDFLNGMRSTEPTKNDLEEYLATHLDQTGVDVEFEILSWWKLKQPKYPILARMAKDILAVPISTVASESTFSTAGRTLSPIRRSLNDESLQALICAQDWLRQTIIENGGVFGDVLWSSNDGSPEEQDDTICGSMGGSAT